MGAVTQQPSGIKPNERELARLAADPCARRCMAFHSGQEPTLDALVACYLSDPSDPRCQSPQKGKAR